MVIRIWVSLLSPYRWVAVFSARAMAGAASIKVRRRMDNILV
jgi:hypothetical protein